MEPQPPLPEAGGGKSGRGLGRGARLRRVAGVPAWARLLIYVFGGVAGAVVGYIVFTAAGGHRGNAPYLAVAAIEGVVFTYLALPVAVREVRRFDAFVRTAELRDLLAGVIGLAAGLALAALVALFIRVFPGGSTISAVLALVFGWAGARFGLARRGDLAELLGASGGLDLSKRSLRAVILDTSIAVDGRIADLLASGFLDVPLVVPRQVLLELQYLADSADPQRRARGRRGFDTLDALQRLPAAAVEFLAGPEEASDRRPVDEQLLALARREGWAIMTKDYNLTRVARLEGLVALNLHDLARALQPIAIPGEELTVNVVREGREPGQGVAYLEDGTMVVIENGRPFVSQSIAITVTAVRQTAAGRLIFARADGRAEAGDPAARNP